MTHAPAAVCAPGQACKANACLAARPTPPPLPPLHPHPPTPVSLPPVNLRRPLMWAPARAASSPALWTASARPPSARAPWACTRASACPCRCACLLCCGFAEVGGQVLGSQSSRQDSLVQARYPSTSAAMPALCLQHALGSEPTPPLPPSFLSPSRASLCTAAPTSACTIPPRACCSRWVLGQRPWGACSDMRPDQPRMAAMVAITQPRAWARPCQPLPATPCRSHAPPTFLSRAGRAQRQLLCEVGGGAGGDCRGRRAVLPLRHRAPSADDAGAWPWVRPASCRMWHVLGWAAKEVRSAGWSSSSRACALPPSMPPSGRRPPQPCAAS